MRLGWMPIWALLALGCNDADAPACFMRAGEAIEIVEELDNAPEVLKFYGHLDIGFEAMDRPGIELHWAGPENVLHHRWTEWDGSTLIVGLEDRCQWMRDLGEQVELRIRCADVPEFVLHGQGTFDLSLVNPESSVVLDAYAHAGYLSLDCDVDSLTVRLHAGVSVAKATGDVNTLSLFASGLSSLDAGGVQSERAFVNQSAHPPIYFRASEYAYVALNSHGNVYGGANPPQDYLVEEQGGGALIWED